MYKATLDTVIDVAIKVLDHPTKLNTSADFSPSQLEAFGKEASGTPSAAVQQRPFATKTGRLTLPQLSTQCSVLLGRWPLCTPAAM